MTHIKMIAREVAEQTGAEYQTAYTAARMALEAIPAPAPGVRWDFYRVPDELVQRVTGDAIDAVNSMGRGGADPLQPLRDAQADFADAERELDRAREGRDAAIRDARRAGVPIAALQEITGLSRQRVSRICSM